MLRVPVFRIFYSTGFSLLLLFTLALLAVSPADVIFQSYRNRARWGIVIVAGVYLLVVLVTLFIYATRLYATRIHLAAIPKSRLPLQKGDLPRSVRRLVLAGIERSASIAFRAKPRDITDELRKRIEKAEGQEVPVSGLTATWGELSHAGWAAPHDHEMPNMHYAPVLQELPHLLEARAVSLAPVNASAAAMMDPEPNVLQLEELEQLPHQQSLPDPITVALLQRLPSASLRSYIGQLIELDVLPDADLAAEFLRLYETARFSGGPLHDRDFRVLMASFAQLIDTVQEPNIVALNRAAGLDDEASILTGQGGGEQEEKQEHRVESDQDSEPSVISRPKTTDASRQQSIDRLAPPKLQLTRTRTRTRSSTSQSQGTADFSSSFATPGLISTPFYTPYIEPTSARTASTGSLAGSEGTSDSEADKVSKRSRSRKRNASTFSYRSRLSQRTIGARNDSKNEHGLGLELKGDHVSESAAPAAAAAISKNDEKKPQAEELAQSSSSDLDSSDASGNEADAMDEDEEESSVRRLDIGENSGPNRADLRPSTSSRNSDFNRSAVHRRGHKAQPGRF